MSEDSEEDIVSATQAELAFLLVFVFVALLGFYVSGKTGSAGSGQALQGLPEAQGPGAIVREEGKSDKRDGEKPQTPLVGPRRSTGPEIAAGATRQGVFGTALPSERETACNLTETGSGRFSLLLEGSARPAAWQLEVKFDSCEHRRQVEEDEDKLLSQECANKTESCAEELSSQKQLFFMAGRPEITRYGRSCLSDLCNRIYDAYSAQRDHLQHVLIEGYTSSEWKAGMPCEGTKRSPGKRSNMTGLLCNLHLSSARAVSIFEQCWNVLSKTRKVKMEDYQSIFKPIGRGPSVLRYDGMGCEKRRESRRVEFVFVDR
jgi:outer membrane protein OmpA-like peptidoglycan-associated protein